jgi:hypothetical protein
MRHLLNCIIHLIASDGSPPWCHRVKGYLHPGLTRIQFVALTGMVVVNWDQPVLVESDESAQDLSWEPWVVSARGPEEAILVESTVGVVIYVHLKNSHENITNPKVIKSEK